MRQRSPWITVSAIVAALAVVAIIGFCVYKYINSMSASATSRPGEKSGQGMLWVRFGSDEDFGSLLCSQLSVFCQAYCGLSGEHVLDYVLVGRV